MTDPTTAAEDRTARARAFADGEIPASPDAVRLGREIVRELLIDLERARNDRDEWRAGAIEAIRENERNLARVAQLETLADSLRDCEAKLVALEAAGVDNWVGYEAAMEMLKEDSDDE